MLYMGSSAHGAKKITERLTVQLTVFAVEEKIRCCDGLRRRTDVTAAGTIGPLEQPPLSLVRVGGNAVFLFARNAGMDAMQCVKAPDAHHIWQRHISTAQNLDRDIILTATCGATSTWVIRPIRSK
jgi:hypothetical protein